MSGFWQNVSFISLATIISSVVAGIISALTSSRSSQKNKYIDTVTSERIKWLEKLRSDISRFSGLTKFWVRTFAYNNDDPKSLEIIKEIDILRDMIKLRLNPEGPHDRVIIQLLDKIPLLTNKPNLLEFENAIDSLISESQKLLKSEWEKAKQETLKGKLVR